MTSLAGLDVAHSTCSYKLDNFFWNSPVVNMLGFGIQLAFSFVNLQTILKFKQECLHSGVTNSPKP